VLQLTPQTRILVAIESVDGRKGIDGLVQLCRERLLADPFPGAYLCSAAAAQHPSGSSATTAKDSGWRRNGSQRDAWWPSGSGPARTIEAYQAQLLLAAGNPDTQAAPMWRRIC
jgi:transposase